MKSPFPPLEGVNHRRNIFVLVKLQRRTDDWITSKLEWVPLLPSDLSSRKAITASSVV